VLQIPRSVVELNIIIIIIIIIMSQCRFSSSILITLILQYTESITVNTEMSSLFLISSQKFIENDGAHL
jgi:hypothetical protein